MLSNVEHRVSPITSTTPRRNSGQYRGKKLAFLLLALCVPAALLYARLVLGLAATDTRVRPAQSLWLARWSVAALILFFAVQIISATYLQRLLPRPRTKLGISVQYAAVLIGCILFSLTGAITLEAFGFDLFLRAAGIH